METDFQRVVEVVDGEVIESEAALALFAPALRQEQRRMTAAGPLGILDLRRQWQECFDAWLRDTATSTKTLNAYTRAWTDLLVFCATPSGEVQPVSEYWDITHRHIRAWMEDLATRDIDRRRVKALENQERPRAKGYAAGTISQYLAAVSSFYSYAERNWPVMLPDGREVALALLSGITLNPVRVIKRRTVGGATKREQAYLSPLQLRSFLSAIPSTTPGGLRDRALFMFYIMTGARNSEVRCLQWGDFQERGGRMFWHWKGKGRGRRDSKDAWKDLPSECWDAVKVYLQAVGRWGQLSDEDAIFTAVSHNAVNLPTVGELFDPFGQPLTDREVNRLVKMYAAKAGLDPNDVHVHTLRHSAAMLMDEAGAGLEDIRRFLNHENLNTTQMYLHKMKGERNVFAGKMAELLRL